MRIAQVSSVIESVPPQKYGGVEVVVYNLTEGLIRKGHEVTLFAPANSRTSAKLISSSPKGLRDKPQKIICQTELVQAGRVLELSSEFDVIHCHFGPEVFPYGRVAQLAPCPTVFTLHGRLDIPELQKIYKTDDFRKFNLVSISNDQRHPIPNSNYVATVYNGIDVHKFRFSAKPEDYLYFQGRSSPEKGIVEAIKIAKATGYKLLIVAKVDPFDREYHAREVEPLIDGKQIKFIGELPREETVKFYQRAKALLFPICWREPFGLVMIEAMACGTPVIAPRRASVPEVVKDKKTGFIVNPANMVEEMIAAVKKIDNIDRRECRKHIEENFTVEKMVEGYEGVYQKVIRSWL